MVFPLVHYLAFLRAVAGPPVCPHENVEEKQSMKMRSNLVIVIIMLIYHQNGQINQETRSSTFPLLFFFFTLLRVRDESKWLFFKKVVGSVVQRIYTFTSMNPNGSSLKRFYYVVVNSARLTLIFQVFFCLVPVGEVRAGR